MFSVPVPAEPLILYANRVTRIVDASGFIHAIPAVAVFVMDGLNDTVIGGPRLVTVAVPPVPACVSAFLTISPVGMSRVIVPAIVDLLSAVSG
jgi:hypothetical protein